MQIIKELRKHKGATQTDLAKAVGVSLRTIQTYEQKDASIPTKNLTKIAAFFDLSVADMYLRKMNDEEASYGNQKPFIHFGSRCYPLDFGKNFIVVPLLLTEMQSEYAKSLGEKIEPKHQMKTGFVVEKLHDSSYVAFEISGDSMNDGTIQSIPNKSIVLGVEHTMDELVQDPGLLLDQTMVLVLRDRITCKKIAEVDTHKKEISCTNLKTSPEFNDFKLPFHEILQLFKIVKRQL
ncbi:helix-turn-helix domain-containing protein [Flagellimonas sp.]|uniref:XRE family transcriptional regulator n=1 Tax=Flagellimonas sp. TaxID=2058762 RepID=UPI003F49BAB7